MPSNTINLFFIDDGSVIDHLGKPSLLKEEQKENLVQKVANVAKESVVEMVEKPVEDQVKHITDLSAEYGNNINDQNHKSQKSSRSKKSNLTKSTRNNDDKIAKID